MVEEGETDFGRFLTLRPDDDDDDDDDVWDWGIEEEGVEGVEEVEEDRVGGGVMDLVLFKVEGSIWDFL